MLINGIEFTFGADPEFFVAKDGKPVSAHGLIKGDKKNPQKVGWGAVQVDGMALEFNINPAKGEAGFVRNLNEVMNTILGMVPGYEMWDKPVADFGLEYIEAQPEEAKMLGCEPDFNAYTMDVNPRPNGQTPFRTAAGHIHIGWTENVDPFDSGHFEACATLTKMLDLFLAVPSLLWDEDDRRRQLYGKAGSFRPKPYGMEYRPLSNRWLRKDIPYLPRFIFNTAVSAIEQCFKDPEYADQKFYGYTAQEIVNRGNREAAMQFLRYQAPFKAPKEYKV
jgi:hypothetical protein